MTVIDLPVDYSGVSIGDETARIGVTIPRERLTIEKADEVLCGRRVKGSISIGSDNPDQAMMFDEASERVEATFDIKSFSVKPKAISTGLTFALGEINIESLAHFSKRKGIMRIENVKEIPVDVAEPEPKNDGLPPGTLKAEGPWRDVSLDGVFEGVILKKLKGGGIETVGDLQDFTASEKRLTDISGIGESKAEQIENRMVQFWADNPQYQDES